MEKQQPTNTQKQHITKHNKYFFNKNKLIKKPHKQQQKQNQQKNAKN